MPRRDGTGPIGIGSLSGKGFGICAGLGVGYGLGLGIKRGFRRNFSPDAIEKSQRELLIEQKGLLERRLDVINKQIDS